MKDYIYPLRNVTLDIAFGEERSARLYSPNVQQAFFFYSIVKIKSQVLWADTRNLKETRRVQQTNLFKYGTHMRQCGCHSILKVLKSIQVQKTASGARTSQGP